MITVIIPTLWFSDFFKKSCDELNETPNVNEIIIIDNDFQNRQIDFNKYGKSETLGSIKSAAGDSISVTCFGKFKVLTPITNLYVTEPWNLGANLAKNEILCILNDDIVLDSKVFDFISKLLTEDVGIIGLDVSCFGNAKTEATLTQVESQPFAFACCMFIKKEKYIFIPETLKVYYNDNFLFKNVQGKHYSFTGAKVSGGISKTVHDSTIKDIMAEIIKQDTIAWQNILLKKI